MNNSLNYPLYILPRLIIIDRVSSLIIFLGKVSIVCGSSILGVYLLSTHSPSDNQAANWAVPLVLIVIFTWLISSGFMSVYDMAIDTIFISFCK
jgi:Plasma-membrane choline transporter